MARISSYPRDREVQDEDSWIGTESSNRITRNFSAKAIADYLNIKGKISISGQMVFKFSETPTLEGEFTGPADGSAISTITAVEISGTDSSGQNVVEFVQYLVDNDILISEQNQLSSFGHFKITSYTALGDNLYTLGLANLGGNGNLHLNKHYDFATFTISSGLNTTYDLNSNQVGTNAAVTLVGSDATTDTVTLVAGTSITLTDDGSSNITIDAANPDLASLIQVGIGNVNASALDNELGIEVVYASGTAKVGLDINGLTLDTLAEQPSDYFLPIYDAGSGINNKARLNELLAFANSVTSKAYTITDTATITYPAEFALTAATQNDTIIQLVDTVTNETVYADVDRISTTQVTITFASTPTNSIRVLVQKIG